MREKVLVADDDPSLTKVVGLALEEAGYQVQVAGDGLEGLRRLYQWRPDLVILDVVMPRMDGWEACQRIREISNVPILMLTGKSGETNELKGLDSGADLYMTKPFSISVLIGRVKALIRRGRLAPESSDATVVTVGELQIDLARHEVTLGGQPVSLSPTEFRLLAALAGRVGRVVPHRELLAEVWGPEYVGENFYLSLYICYLRHKIEKDPGHPRHIITKRGVGYYFNDGQSQGEVRDGPGLAVPRRRGAGFGPRPTAPRGLGARAG